jgi:hypothetical protein
MIACALDGSADMAPGAPFVVRQPPAAEHDHMGMGRPLRSCSSMLDQRERERGFPGAAAGVAGGAGSAVCAVREYRTPRRSFRISIDQRSFFRRRLPPRREPDASPRAPSPSRGDPFGVPDSSSIGGCAIDSKILRSGGDAERCTLTTYNPGSHCSMLTTLLMTFMLV